MKATLSILVLMTFISGFVMIGNAIAQDDTGPPATEEAPIALELPEATDASDELDTAEAPSDTGAEEAKNPVPENPLDQGKGLHTSIKGADWVMAFGFFGMLLGSAARFAVGQKFEFIKSKAGGYTIAGFTGMGILGGLIIEAGTFSASMLPTALLATLAAMALHGPAKAIKKKFTGETAA